MKYVSPVIEIEILCQDDIVMVSGVEVSNEKGSLTEIKWSDFT